MTEKRWHRSVFQLTLVKSIILLLKLYVGAIIFKKCKNKDNEDIYFYVLLSK